MTSPVAETPPGTITSGEHAALGAEGPRRSGVWRRRIFRAVLLLVAVTVGYVTVTFLQVWQASNLDTAQKADAIVVLGAAQYYGRPSPALEGRLRHALQLYRQGLAPHIVVTGGRQQGDTFTEATAGYNWLTEREVPDEAILKEVQGRNTYESLAATARFLEGEDEVILVSDGYHALRVQGIAREVGLRPHVSTVDSAEASITQLGRETVAVSIGRVTGYRRLTRITG